MDVRQYNRDAWNKEVERGNVWTRGVSAAEIAAARAGHLALKLTPLRPMPADWLPRLPALDENARGARPPRILCLASGGGQQGPLLAAAGADVTVFDLSPAQLAQDRLVAEREGLSIATVEGDMADLTAFADGTFDYVLHPVSNCFVPNVLPVWREASRVLRRGGILVAAFLNPIAYAFDKDLERQSIFTLKHALPYSDLTSLSEAERSRYTVYQAPLEFSHTLTTQIGGQIAAGLQLTGFYEDDWGGGEAVDRFFPVFLATRAVKP